jgi:hypothetical protein
VAGDRIQRLHLRTHIRTRQPDIVGAVSHSIQSSGGADLQLEVWFLAQTPWAILHGANPLANNWLNTPSGVNLMDNTSMPLLGVLGAPITLLLSPVATFNILLNLAFAGSATAFFFMARRFVSLWPVAFVGGLLYGFSPFATAEGIAHLFVVVGVVPPLVILVLDREFRSRDGSPWLSGIALGACFVVQFYISFEILASIVVMALLPILIVWFSVVAGRLELDMGRLSKMSISGAAVVLLGIGYGAWITLAGPQHVTGPVQPGIALAGVSSDPVGLIVPTKNQQFTIGHAALGDSLVAERKQNWRIVYDDTTENGTYVGIPLLLCLVVGTIALRRRRIVQLTAVMAAVAFILSMGTYLHFDGHRTGVPLPFIIPANLPFFDNGVAARYSMFFWLFASLLFALIVEALYGAIRADGSAVHRRRAVIGSSLLVVLALFPLVPAWPYGEGPLKTPTWFTTDARSLRDGSTVVVYPFSNSLNASSMVWQAMSNMSFRMPGGFAVFRKGSGHRPDGATFVSERSPLKLALVACSKGQTPQISPETLVSQLRGLHARFVVVSPAASGAPCATGLFAEVLGKPRLLGGVMVWPVSS